MLRQTTIRSCTHHISTHKHSVRRSTWLYQTFSVWNVTDSV